MTIGEFQRLIADAYVARDRERGVEGTFMWFVEEVGELARAIKHGNPDELEEEFADVIAWLVSLATLVGVDMETAVARYANGCPKCHQVPCVCPKVR
ncbi:MAG TPA: nucleotide pyrophosphohydrolase [Armatimonadetes bacterium]|nr:nucleotide pyrophosphohydrolase [Armatimonadota bacterium]